MAHVGLCQLINNILLSICRLLIIYLYGIAVIKIQFIQFMSIIQFIQFIELIEEHCTLFDIRKTDTSTCRASSSSETSSYSLLLVDYVGE